MKHGPRVYSERLRLVLQGIGASLPVGFFLSTLLVVVFYATATRPNERPLLLVWYAAFMLSRVALVWFSRHTLRRGDFAEVMPGISRTILFGKLYEGAVWGSLTWIAVGVDTPATATALLLALMAAISSNAVSLLSPILRLYLALMLPMLVLTACRFFLLDGLIFKGMGVCCLLYVFGQTRQARLIGRDLTETIRLRFENLDLIDRLKAEKALASEAREAAEQANLAKSHFLAAASHDLRQPVHALGLFLEAMSLNELAGSQREILGNAKAASLASSDMLNTLLDFSRIEAGVIRPKPRAFLLQDLLHKLEVELAPQADANSLIYRSRDTRRVLFSDPTLLELILRNLISNAIRYTTQGGVLIGCRTRGNGVSIDVYDTGIGIEPDQQQNVFREFHQLGNPERDRRKGLGLGLAIVERLARSLDHPLQLQSRPGAGTVFRVWVPMARAHALPERLDELFPIDRNLVGVRVLVVDDDESVRLGMHHLLGSWGCRCRVAESLDEALSFSWTVPPDAIVCDYRLRERQTGADAIRLIRKHFDRSIPALLITGDTAPERLREAEASGIPLLHKPVAAPQLYKALLGLREESRTG